MVDNKIYMYINIYKTPIIGVEFSFYFQSFPLNNIFKDKNSTINSQFHIQELINIK